MGGRFIGLLIEGGNMIGGMEAAAVVGSRWEEEDGSGVRKWRGFVPNF